MAPARFPPGKNSPARARCAACSTVPCSAWSVYCPGVLTIGLLVELTAYERDRYKRLVARVVVEDGRDLGREMVRAGLAWHYVRYPRDPELARTEIAGEMNPS